jgi:transcriptional regulator with XRE-family HTH domain
MLCDYVHRTKITVKEKMSMPEDFVEDAKIENFLIGSRLRKELEGVITFAKAAEIAGVTPKTMQRWMNGDSSVDVGAVIKICRATGKNPVFILTGMNGESGDWETPLPPTRIGEKRVPIRDVSASAGHGLEVFYEAPKSWITFSLEWLMTLGDPDAMEIITVEGDSMEPELRDADHVMIDRSQRQMKDGMFVVLVDDRLFLKRLRVRGRDKVELVSTNPNYPPYEVTIPSEDDDVAQDGAAIVGKVVWSGRTQ